MTTIAMKSPLVEMDGDEMTRVLWVWVKDKLISPYVDLKTEYYDLGLEHRDKTDDQVTLDAAEATKRLGVAVKCATITPNHERVVEYKLKKQWKSPNGTIRAALDGTVFRKPILVDNIKPGVVSWTKPIIVGRHAYGDVYKNAEIAVPGPGKGELVFTGADGSEQRVLIHEFKGPGILQGDPQHREVDPQLRPLGLQLRARREGGRLVRDQGHHLEDLRPDVPADLRGRVREGVRGPLQGRGHRVLLHAHRRRGGEDREGRGRDAVGVQELRRRRDVRHGRVGVRQPGDDDLGAGVARRLLRVRGRARHRAAALLQAPEGREDLEQLDGADLRVDRRAAEARRAGQPAGSRAVRRAAGAGVAGHHRGRRDDGRPRAPSPAEGEAGGDERGVHRRDRHG